jgi:integrase
LAAILEHLDPEEHLADARDAALLLVGWRAALRTDDLARLDLEDISTTEEGLLVRLRRSKTDQTGAGATVGSTATPEDPPGAVAAWTRWRNRMASHVFHTGPIWRGIDPYRRRARPTRLTTKALDTIITRRAQAGLEGDYGGHSLRRGSATSALAGGAGRTRHATPRPVALTHLHGRLCRRGRTLRRHQPPRDSSGCSQPRVRA